MAWLRSCCRRDILRPFGPSLPPHSLVRMLPLHPSSPPSPSIPSPSSPQRSDRTPFSSYRRYSQFSIVQASIRSC
eukprot:4985011-Pleurochrysis_carterae.AAC.1